MASLDAFELSRPSSRRSGRLILPPGDISKKLDALIQYAESPRKGYGAIHHSAKRLPGKRPTQMTLSEIFHWINETPKQHHAIGRYQIIPSTLAELVSKTKTPLSAVYSPALQDKFALHLYRSAGLDAFLSGKLSNERFMDNLARVWAGLPLKSGKSAYHKYAGNRATITRAEFRKAMMEIFPKRP